MKGAAVIVVSSVFVGAASFMLDSDCLAALVFVVVLAQTFSSSVLIVLLPARDIWRCFYYLCLRSSGLVALLLLLSVGISRPLPPPCCCCFVPSAHAFLGDSLLRVLLPLSYPLFSSCPS